MAGEPKPFEINCPCCGALVVLDPATRAVLRFEAPKRPPGASFEEMLKEVGESKKKTESKLQRALEEQKQREEILEKRFREAIKKAETSTEKPIKPFDLD
ncbi:MAG TPA: hypothetical protein VFG76_00375 [Candidatus Polarisedimenticolia bacterium]|nr:hypothetical protein [Candidatus Polarisedimenticolia bacterium]